MSSTGRKLRRGAVNLLVAVLALLLALVAAEAALAIFGVGDSPSDAWRTRGLQQPDAELIYSMRPSSQRAWRTDEFVERAGINAMGLRGAEISPDEDERFRIVILGDSMTYGHGVSNVENYPFRLHRLIHDRNPELGIEVINAGTRGYGTDHSYKLFVTRLRSLAPEIVIFALNYNDVGDDINYPLYALEDGRLKELDATRSPLYKVARWSDRVPEAIADYRLTRLLIHSAGRLATRGYSATAPSEDQVDWAKEKILVQLRSMARMAEEDGFRFLVLGMPMKETKWLPFEWLAEPIQEIAPLLDLSLDPSWRDQKEEWFFLGNDHFNVAGNQRAAEHLYDDLSARGWLEARP